MKEKALDNYRPSALRTAPTWAIRKIEQERKSADAARRRKTDAKGAPLDVQHKLRELELAEATL